MTSMYREPIKVLADIIQKEMELTDDQVMTTNQKFFIPTDGLLVSVSYVGPSKIISIVDEWVDDGAGGLTENQAAVMLHMIQIDILGYGNDARTRKEEIIMAIGSLFSEAQQEQNSMQLARQPGPFMDTSFLEETKMVTRYTTTLTTSSISRKQKVVGDFYTDFSRAVPPQLVVNA